MKIFLLLATFFAISPAYGDEMKGSFGNDELGFKFLGKGAVDVTYQFRRPIRSSSGWKYGPTETTTIRGDVKIVSRSTIQGMKDDEKLKLGSLYKKLIVDFSESKGYKRIISISFPNDSERTYILVEHKSSLVDVFTSTVHKERGWFK